MIVMEHSCRLNALCFLARSVSCPFVIQSFSAVNISSPFLSFFFFFSSKHISVFLKEAVCGQNLQFLPTIANWQTICLPCLLSGTWKPDEFAEPPVLQIHTRMLGVVYSMCYVVYVTISVLGPFFSVLVSPFSVKSIL